MSPSLQLAEAADGRCGPGRCAAPPATCWSARRTRVTGGRDLTADTTLESDFILLELWRHPPQNGVWNPPTRPLVDKAVQSILARQLPDGGFNIYAEGPSEISATVKAYTALKLAGLAYDDPESDAGAGTNPRARRIAGAPTATSRSISACSISIRAKPPRRFRRSACCWAI